MKNQKQAKSTKPEEKKPLTIEKVAEMRKLLIENAAEEVKEPTAYIIVKNDDVEQLLVTVNILIKLKYEPLGGASFSTKLGFWYQSMLLPPANRVVKTV